MKYTTIQGDAWDGISFKLYGDERYMNILMHANPDHAHTVIFSAGVHLAVPDIPVGTSNTLPPWKQYEY